MYCSTCMSVTEGLSHCASGREKTVLFPVACPDTEFLVWAIVGVSVGVCDHRRFNCGDEVAVSPTS